MASIKKPAKSRKRNPKRNLKKDILDLPTIESILEYVAPSQNIKTIQNLIMTPHANYPGYKLFTLDSTTSDTQLKAIFSFLKS